MEHLELPDTAFDLSFHPRRHVVASGLVTGSVLLHSYGEEGHSQLLETKVHNGKSARCVGFDHEGRDLYSAGADCLLHSMDADTGATKWRVEDAHEHPIHSMCKLEEGQAAPWLLATGDDQGVVKVWDTRQRKPAMWMSEQTDYVSGICEGNEGKSLLAVSADMTLAVLNLRSGKLEGRSDEQEDELLSISVLKGGRKIACGCQNGVILLWSWGRWGDCSDRIPGHPQSVDALVKLDEDTLLSGCSDGLLRVVQVHPNKFLGVLGDHDSFPVERMAFSYDHAWIGTVSHDNSLRFWDASVLNENEDEEEDGNVEDEEEDDSKGLQEMKGGSEEACGRPRSKRQKMGLAAASKEDDNSDESDSQEEAEADSKDISEEGESESESSSSSDDSGDEGDAPGRAPLKTAAEKFFSDL